MAQRLEELEEYLVNLSHRTYDARGERAAIRSGLGDAVTMLDALADEQIAGKRRSKQRLAAHSLIKAAAERIWAFRERIVVPPPSPRPRPRPRPAPGTQAGEP